MPNYAPDFREIAHCGGQITIQVVMDLAGRREVHFGFRHSRPVPATVSGIYALIPHGIPQGDFGFGGLGMGFNPPPPPRCIPVFLASDSEGKYGRECPACGSLFRNQQRSLPGLCCPYCGHIAESFEFLTPSQLQYVRHYAEKFVEVMEQDIEPGTHAEHIIDMDAIIDHDQNVERPPFYYSSEAQQTIFNCHKCNEFNDIRGIYGYCSVCWSRNNESSLRKSFDDLRSTLNSGNVTAIEAVKGSVSKFDAGCRDMLGQLVKRMPMRHSRREEFGRLKFHDIGNSTFNRIKSMFEIDILRGISAGDIEFIKLMLHRRHVYEHSDGVADRRYVVESGDTSTFEGALIRENQENANKLIGLLSRMMSNFQSDFHELFPVNEGPIRYYNETQERIRAMGRT